MKHICEFCGFEWDCGMDDCFGPVTMKSNCALHGGTDEKFVKYITDLKV